MRRRVRRVQPRSGTPALHDQVDRLGRERPILDGAPPVDGSKDRSLRNVGSHSFRAATGAPTSRTFASSSAEVVLVRPRWIARQGRGVESGSVESTGTGDSSCNCSRRSPATSLRRQPPEAKATIMIARSRVSTSRSEAQVATSRSRMSRVTARRLLRWRGRADARTASCKADRRAGEPNGPSRPFQR